MIVYSRGNISAKNYQNQLIGVEVIKCNVSVVFLDTVWMINCSDDCGCDGPPSSASRHFCFGASTKDVRKNLVIF